MSETTSVKRKCNSCGVEFSDGQTIYFGSGNEPYCHGCFTRDVIGLTPERNKDWLAEKQPKPSLGLTPRGIWLDARRGEVLRAIRDKAASSTSADDAKLIGEWACELIWTEEQIKNNAAMNCNTP